MKAEQYFFDSYFKNNVIFGLLFLSLVLMYIVLIFFSFF